MEETRAACLARHRVEKEPTLRWCAVRTAQTNIVSSDTSFATDLEYTGHGRPRQGSLCHTYEAADDASPLMARRRRFACWNEEWRCCSMLFVRPLVATVGKKPPEERQPCL